jgi:nucleolar GTP-binding protein
MLLWCAMNLRKLPKEAELLEIALRRARKQAAGIGRQKSRLKWEKSREIKRVETASNYVIKALDSAVREFPNLGKLSPFYAELVRQIIDADETKKALGQFSAVSKIAGKLKRTHIIKIKSLGRGSEGKAAEISRQFMGRMASALKSLQESVRVYNNAAEKLRELPKLREEPTVIIAGCPNVGKSTLLGKITESKPKVAAYPFTTKRLEIGYFRERYMEYQVIDTPGLLDRPLQERNPVERKGIAALRHLASLIVFVVDPTEQCGFSLQQQLGLLESIAAEFGKEKIVVYLSKTDTAENAEIEAAREKLRSFKLIGGIVKAVWMPKEAHKTR